MRSTLLVDKTFSKRFSHDIREKISKIQWNIVLLNFSVIIFLLAFGILARFLLAYYFRLEFFDETATSIWLRDVQKNPLNFPFHGFSDFSYYYEAWAGAWHEGDWYPYIWVDINLFRTSPLYIYSYTPFFLYFLTIFYRPGSHILWLALPLVATDSLCAGMVYLILRKLVKGTHSLSISIFGGFLMVLAPINLLYNGVYWLNPGPMTLLTLIAIYCALDKKWWQAFFWLAIATMTKQNALFITYPLFLMMLGNKLTKVSIKKAITESVMIVLLFGFIFIVGAFPYILITPIYYVYHLAIPGKMLTLNTIVNEVDDRCISFSQALNGIGIRGWLLDVVAFGVNSMLLMIVTATAIAVFLFWRTYMNKLTKIGFIDSITLYIILTLLFIPPGVFKFYAPFFTPFIIISLVASMAELFKKNHFKAFGLISVFLLVFGSNLWLIIIERVYFPLILFGLCIIIGMLNLSRLIFNKKQNLFSEKAFKTPL